MLVIVAALAGCAKGTEKATSTTTSAPKPSTTSTNPAPRRPSVTTDGTYAVAATSLDVVEPVGGTSRQLPTTVWYPALDAGGVSRADLARAPYPLLVFSQGYDLSVQTYQALLEAWSSAGFVVAAPTYPHTDPSDPAELEEADIVNHPADLRFVITAVLQAATRPGTAIAGLVNPDEVGLIGHSDGGDVSLAVAENSCCRDPRVKAVAVLSGAELASFGGSYFSGGSVPSLIVQGTLDTINPPDCSLQIYQAAPPPKYYLTLVGAAHGQPYVEPGTDQTIVARVVTDFFDAELAGQPAALGTMMSDGNVAGATQITDAPLASVPASACPGSPG